MIVCQLLREYARIKDDTTVSSSSPDGGTGEVRCLLLHLVEICKQKKDRQTDRHADHKTIHTYWEQSNKQESTTNSVVTTV